jgi:serine/threonine protein kinase
MNANAVPNTVQLLSLGKGGEAEVYDLGNGSVLKVYHRDAEISISAESALRLQALIDRYGNHSDLPIVMPIEVYTDWEGKLVAYEMEKAQGQVWLKARKALSPEIRIVAVQNLYKAIKKLHGLGWIIGDLNEEGILVSDSGDVKLIEPNSVGFDEFAPFQGGQPLFIDPQNNPSKMGWTKESDLWAFCMLSYMMLYHMHPFSGVTKPIKPIPRRIALGEPHWKVNAIIPKGNYLAGSSFLQMVREYIDLRTPIMDQEVKALEANKCSDCNRTLPGNYCYRCDKSLVQAELVWHDNKTMILAEGPGQYLLQNGSLVEFYSVSSGQRIRLFTHSKGTKYRVANNLIASKRSGEKDWRVTGVLASGKVVELGRFKMPVLTKPFTWIQDGFLFKNRKNKQMIGSALAGVPLVVGQLVVKTNGSNKNLIYVSSDTRTRIDVPVITIDVNNKILVEHVGDYVMLIQNPKSELSIELFKIVEEYGLVRVFGGVITNHNTTSESVAVVRQGTKFYIATINGNDIQIVVSEKGKRPVIRSYSPPITPKRVEAFENRLWISDGKSSYTADIV